MEKIFISYRREDVADATARIRDSLAARFGAGGVFMDVDNLLAGQRFDRKLAAALDQCDVLIAVIGPRWLELLNAKLGGREPDYVRSEIAGALKRGIIVIPVRVGRIDEMPRLPRAGDLPEDLRDLVLHGKADIASERFARDVADLNDSVLRARKDLDGAPPVRRSLAWPVLIAATAILALAGSWYTLFRPSREASSPQVITPTMEVDRGPAERARQAQLAMAEEERRAALARKAEVERQAASARKAEEELQAALARKAEVERQAASARKAEEELQAALARKAEVERQAASARKAEEELQAALARKAEEERQAALARKAEEERQAARVRKIDEERQAALIRKAEEERRAALARKAEEERLAVEAKRLQEEELFRSIQKELTRLGCYSGKSDGVWGELSRQALEAFDADLAAAVQPPSVQVLDALKQAKSTSCVRERVRPTAPVPSSPARQSAPPPIRSAPAQPKSPPVCNCGAGYKCVEGGCVLRW